MITVQQRLQGLRGPMLDMVRVGLRKEGVRIPWWWEDEYDRTPPVVGKDGLPTAPPVNLTKLQRLVWADDFMAHEYRQVLVGYETVTTKDGEQQRRKYEWRRVRSEISA